MRLTAIVTVELNAPVKDCTVVVGTNTVEEEVPVASGVEVVVSVKGIDVDVLEEELAVFVVVDDVKGGVVVRTEDEETVVAVDGKVDVVIDCEEVTAVDVDVDVDAVDVDAVDVDVVDVEVVDVVVIGNTAKKFQLFQNF